MEKTARLRVAYAAPKIEVCAADLYRFLAASNTNLSGNAGDGDDNGEITGAKMFEFSSPWDGLEER